MQQEEILDFSKMGQEDEEIIIDFSQVAEIAPRPDLSDEQKAARDAPPNTVVVAAPGAGKTEVLIQRHEQNEARGIKSLSLTFTVAAANEIKHRIPGARASTIHAFCFRELDFTWAGSYPDLLKSYVLLKEKEKFDEVLVDEAQNLSPLMMSVIKAIPKTSIFAVGDPYQSCYIGEWARNLWDAPAMGRAAFDSLSKVCKTVEIKGNRRSNEHVVSILEQLQPRKLIPLGPKSLTRNLIVARSHKILRSIHDYLALADIPHLLYKKRDSQATKYDTFGSKPVADLLVYHQCIGTAYKRVFLFDWNGYEEEDYNLLYTAVARATEEVFVVDAAEHMCSMLPQSLRITSPDMLDILEG